MVLCGCILIHCGALWVVILDSLWCCVGGDSGTLLCCMGGDSGTLCCCVGGDSDTLVLCGW